MGHAVDVVYVLVMLVAVLVINTPSISL